MHSIAGKAVCFYEALKPEFKTYCKQIIINSKVFAKKFLELGVPIVTGGTDNHLFTINVKEGYELTGKTASTILQSVNITVNKNTIPFDKESPFVTSGIRLGTAAMTSRNLKSGDFELIATLIDQALKNTNNDKIIKSIKSKVAILTKKFPIVKKY
jgi:glycine hydroxymethyltransferase